MSDLKPTKSLLSIGDKTFNIVLTLSVIEALQERYDDLNGALEMLGDFKSMTKELAEIASVFINDDIDCHNEDFPNDKWEKVNPKWICRRIALNEKVEGKILAVELSAVIMQAFKLSMPENEDADPNPTTTE